MNVETSSSIPVFSTAILCSVLCYRVKIQTNKETNKPSFPTLQVPSRDQATPDESLREFFEEVPALGLLGTPHPIYAETPYVVDADVQLVCKYLKAYRVGGTKGIDRLYRESRSHIQ